MSNKVIAILSVLKPVDDTRNFEKIATSISNTNKYDINIIGFSSKNILPTSNIKFYPLFSFPRMSFKRLYASFIIFKKLVQLKPQLIIVTCAELLIVIYLYKIIFGCKIIYDIQENYYLNITSTNTYPVVIKYPLARIVRIIERIGRPLINRYILAEKVYSEQLAFTKSKAVIIENKAVIPPNIHYSQDKRSGTITFIYAGTIAEHYGIFEAIEFVKRVYHSNQKASLKIVGHAPSRRIYKKMVQAAKHVGYIEIIGGDHLVPHDQVLKEMSMADFCLLPYQSNQSTAGRIPTKLYECLSLEIPIIISPNAAWDGLIKANNAGIIHDFQFTEIPEHFFDNNHYYGNNLKDLYLWKSEESRLIETIKELI